MAVAYTWDCKTVDVHPTQEGKSDVVYNVHWRLTGTSNKKDAAQRLLDSMDLEEVCTVKSI